MLSFFMFFHSINSSQIRCMSAGFDVPNVTNATSGPVQVFIDNAVAELSGEEFEFRNNPSYMRVSPQNVIPA